MPQSIADKRQTAVAHQTALEILTGRWEAKSAKQLTPDGYNEDSADTPLVFGTIWVKTLDGKEFRFAAIVSHLMFEIINALIAYHNQLLYLDDAILKYKSINYPHDVKLSPDNVQNNEGHIQEDYDLQRFERNPFTLQNTMTIGDDFYIVLPHAGPSKSTQMKRFLRAYRTTDQGIEIDNRLVSNYILYLLNSMLCQRVNFAQAYL